MATVPLIEAADCTNSGNNTATTSWAVSYPAYSAGDLLIFHIASDANVTHNWSATGPNSETVVDISDSAGGTAQRASAFYYIAGGAQSAGTFTVTPSATEQWTATVVRVPAGEFDAADPIDFGATTNVTTAAVNAASPAWTAGVADGRVCVWFASDTVRVTAAPAGWTLHASVDRGAVGGAFATRDAGTTASESIASATFTKTSETHTSIGYVVNAPPDVGTIGTPVDVGSDVTGTTTGSVAATGLTSGHRLYAFVGSRSNSAYTNKPSVSDTQGLTWTEVADVYYDTGANPWIRCTAFSAITNGSDTTISCDTNEASARVGFHVISISGSGSPSLNVAYGTDAAGDPSATISAVASGSAAFYFAALQNNLGITEASGYTELLDTGQSSSPQLRITSGYDLSSPATTAALTSGNVNSAIILMEIAEFSPTAYTLAADSATYAVTSTTAGVLLGREVAADTAGYAVTATAAGVLHSKRVAADTTAYSYAATAAGLLDNRKVSADAASYAVTSTDATLRRAIPLVADAAGYTYTATDAGLVYGVNKTLTADAATYTYTATAAGVLHNWRVSADSAAYNVTATAATLARAIPIAADTAGYSYTATAAGLLEGHRLTADSASYSLGATAANFARTWLVEAGSASYAVTAGDAGLSRSIPLSAEPASYAIGVTDAGLLFGGRLEADSAAYAYTADAAALVKTGQTILLAESGTYDVTAGDAGLLAVYLLGAEGADYAVTAEDAGFVYAYAVAAESAAYEFAATDAGLVYDGEVAGPVPVGKPGRKKKRLKIEPDPLLWPEEAKPVVVAEVVEIAPKPTPKRGETVPFVQVAEPVEPETVEQDDPDELAFLLWVTRRRA